MDNMSYPRSYIIKKSTLSYLNNQQISDNNNDMDLNLKK